MSKRSKRRRQQRRTLSVPRLDVVRPFSLASLLSVVEAASCSPTAAHRLQSLGVIFANIIRDGEGGHPDATAADLPELVDAVGAVLPMWHLEDYIPADSRLIVLVRWRNRLFRLLPGSLERPVAMIERARMVAEAVDGRLLSTLGFTLSDMCELVLQRVDTAATTFVSSWGTATVDGPAAPPTLTELELDAARTLPGLAETVDRCTDPQRAALALSWATTEAVNYEPSAGRATFGRTLAVKRAGAIPTPIPSGFWIDALDTIINDLAGLAVADNPDDADTAFRRRTATELARVLKKLKRPIARRVPINGLGEIHSVINFGKATEVAVDFSAGLRNRADNADRALERLEAYEPNGIDVLRIHVTAGSGHI